MDLGWIFTGSQDKLAAVKLYETIFYISDNMILIMDDFSFLQVLLRYLGA